MGDRCLRLDGVLMGLSGLGGAYELLEELEEGLSDSEPRGTCKLGAVPFAVCRGGLDGRDWVAAAKLGLPGANGLLKGLVLVLKELEPLTVAKPGVSTLTLSFSPPWER